MTTMKVIRGEKSALSLHEEFKFELVGIVDDANNLRAFFSLLFFISK